MLAIFLVAALFLIVAILLTVAIIAFAPFIVAEKTLDVLALFCSVVALAMILAILVDHSAVIISIP